MSSFAASIARRLLLKCIATRDLDGGSHLPFFKGKRADFFRTSCLDTVMVIVIEAAMFHIHGVTSITGRFVFFFVSSFVTVAEAVIFRCLKYNTRIAFVVSRHLLCDGGTRLPLLKVKQVD